jgi:hypothetical protein
LNFEKVTERRLIESDFKGVIIQPYDFKASGKTPMNEQRALNLGNDQNGHFPSIVFNRILEAIY